MDGWPKKLLELSDTHGLKVEDGIRIEVRLTQQELASMVGASRESVTKFWAISQTKSISVLISIASRCIESQI